MSSRGKKNLKSPKKISKSSPKPNQTVMSMFKKQTDTDNSKKVVKRKLSADKSVTLYEDDDDDDFKIVRCESKSKYFRHERSDSSVKVKERETKSRRLSLRSQSSLKKTSSNTCDQISSENQNSAKCSNSSQKENTYDNNEDDSESNKTQNEETNLPPSNTEADNQSKSLSPSKKLSMLKRRSKKQTSFSSVAKNDSCDEPDDNNSSSIVVSDDDFSPPLKKKTSLKVLKTKESQQTKRKTSRNRPMGKTLKKTSSTNVTELSRENSKQQWNALFESVKKKDDKEAQKILSSDNGVPDKMANSKNVKSRTAAPSESSIENLTVKEMQEPTSSSASSTVTCSEQDEGIDQTSDKALAEDVAGGGDPVDQDVNPLGEGQTKTGEEGEGQTKYRTPYYLENFQTILTAVLGDEDNYRLFDDADRAHIETFNTLSEPGQKLYVRLFSRKLAWLPLNKINYPEISTDLSSVLQELIECGLAISEDDLHDLEQTLKVMSAMDLKTLAKTFHINCTGLTKIQISDGLLKKSRQSTVSSMFGGGKGASGAMLNRAKKLLGRSVRLKDEPRRVFVRVLMLFSVVHSSLEDDQANGGQPQLYQMLLVNMGKVVYPEIQVNKKTSLIKDRDSLFRIERAMQYESDLIGLIEKHNWAGAYDIYTEAKNELQLLMADEELVSFDKSLPPFLRSCTAGSVLTKVLNQGIEILQRRKDYPAAIALIRQLLEQGIYCADYRGYWWERMALNLEAHLKQPLQALEAISSGLSDEHVKVGHRLALFLRAEKLCTAPNSKYKHKMKEFTHEEVQEAPKEILEGKVLPHSIPGLRFSFMTEDSYSAGNSEDVTVCGVEELVLSHYRLHVEGSIVSILFNLYFWDVLYMDVADAFHSPYQTRPLDFHSPYFYIRRQEAIDQRLQDIEAATEQRLHEMMQETWERHFGKMCAGLNWERFRSLEHCQGLVSCIQGKVLAGILRRYAINPRHTRSGFPDLTLWNTETKQFKICEVKGPGDRLSHKQILWLDHLLKLGVDAEVCHVKAVGAKKLKPEPKASTSTTES